MTKRTHLVVGAGRMGGALLKGWLADPKSGVTPHKLIILDPEPGEAAKTAIKSGAKQLKSPDKLLAHIDCVLLAIKPQMFDSLAGDIAAQLPDGSLVISILAGTSMNSLESSFAAQNIIRAMPNTPAAIGEGIIAFTCGPGVTEMQRKQARTLLSAGGVVYEVEGEHMIDVVTAVSGSGPAYVFHMVEALEDAARQAGMPKELAPEFARQTIVGAGALLKSSAMSASELREAVTSPGGTTQAALDVLMAKDGLTSLMKATVLAALNRAKELAGLVSYRI